MKKTNFLKGLAAVVLGCMFTSCEKEELKATFVPDGAKITINASAYDGLTGEKIDNATFNASNSEFQDAINNTKEMPSGKGIDVTTFTITAEYNNVTSEPATIEIKEAIKAGSEVVYNVELIISDELAYTYEDKTIKTSEVWASSTELHSVTHSHDGNSNWFKNTTDYYQPYTFTVSYNPVEAVSEINWVNKNNEEVINAIHKTWTEKVDQVTSFPFNGKASAWSYFNAKATYNVVERTYTVSTKVTEDKIATFTITMVADVKVEPKEFAAVGHDSHYHGHGHGHGGASNAGGGISIAE